MIKRLKRRIILLVLAGLLLASAGLVIAINWMNWNSLEQQASAVLDMLAENGGQRPIQLMRLEERDFDPNMTPPPMTERGETPPAPRNGGDWSPDPGWAGSTPPGFAANGGRFARSSRGWNNNLQNAANLSNYFTAILNTDGTVTEWSSEREDLYTDEEVAALAESALASGRETGRVDSQFYRLTQRNGQRMLIVIDRSLEMQNAAHVLELTALVAVIEDALLSLGAVWLIRRMVKPVDEAMEKQKQFVWDASHELKTPLAVISANAEALSAEVGESKPLEYIQSEVQRTDKLIQNLLTLARMEKGTVQAQHAKFDLSRAVMEVVLPFESAVFEAGKTMNMDIPDGIEYTGDGEMIKQLAVILLSNAQKYSDEGGTIDLSLEVKGEKRLLKVHNTGPAISEADQQKIFDRFYRVDSSHNRDIEGNGLGLAIAQSIVAIHKGKITVHSTEGEGTTFTVIL